jgi:protein-L-isoaspartate(D-aspartate) O-methyltransferase
VRCRCRAGLLTDGYQTALLTQLAADVISIEIYPDIAKAARWNLIRRGITNVQVITGDGTEGYPEGAPHDAVLASAAHPEVLSPLIEQLHNGGGLVQPIGPGGNEDVILFERIPGGLVAAAGTGDGQLCPAPWQARLRVSARRSTSRPR